MQKTKIKKIALWVGGIVIALIVLAIVGFYAFRNTILEKAVAKISAKAERDYNSTFAVDTARFSGFSDIEMHGISLVPKNADTLMAVKSLKTSINISEIIFGNLQLGTLTISDGYIQLIKNKRGWNFSSFLNNKKKLQETPEEEASEKNYARRAYSMLNRALNLVPTDMALKNLELKVNDNGRKLNVKMQQMRLADKQLQSDIILRQDSLSQNWKINGFADPRDIKADLEFYNNDSTRIIIPYISKRFNLTSGFDSVRLKIDNIDMNGGEMRVDGSAAIKNFMVNHPKIAKKDVVIDSARFDYHARFGEDYIELDSSSVAQLNKIILKPFARYSVKNDTVYQFKTEIPKMPAQDFIVSLPTGLFTNFEGMVAEGEFSYNLDFLYNKSKPDDLVFNSSLKKEGLKIIKYGKADLAKLNTSFTYRAIDNGKQQRPVVVGPSNPYYTPLENISPYVINAVLTSEDPSFYSHRGFITEAFRQSIIKNIKAKRFARGGSTISMQLVKNVFLTREKTVSRKLEEILLVYLLENNRIASKARMLEVYFNIIEWGPNIYGIGEASNYYFDKHPSQLTLDEGLYLASIVPRPKAYMWRFNDKGLLKDYAVRHDNYIKNIMLRRGLISPTDTIAQTGQIYIAGRARANMNIKEDAEFAKDSLDFDNFFLKLGNTTF